MILVKDRDRQKIQTYYFQIYVFKDTQKILSLKIKNQLNSLVLKRASEE